MATTTTNYGFQKPDEEDFYDIEVSNQNWDKADQTIKQLDNGKVNASGGDISNTKITALDTSTAAFPVPNAGETPRVFLGKVKKFTEDFNNFKTGIITVGKLANNLQTTEGGYALDARAGKTLNDAIARLNSDLGVTLTTDILAYALLSSTKVGVTFGNFSGASYSGTLPVDALRYGTWEINKRSSSSISVKCQDIDNNNIWTNTYANNTWKGWVLYIKKSDFEQSIDSPGFVKLPTGFIMQWGSVPYPANQDRVEVALPVAFSLSSVFAIASTGYKNSMNNIFKAGGSGKDKVIIHGIKVTGGTITTDETVNYLIIGK